MVGLSKSIVITQVSYLPPWHVVMGYTLFTGSSQTDKDEHKGDMQRALYHL